MAQLKDTRIYGNLIVDTLLTTKKAIILDTVETIDFIIKNNSLDGTGNISIKLINNADESNYWSIDTNKTTKNIDFIFNVSNTDKSKKISIDNNGDLYIKDGTKKVWHTGTFNPDNYFPLSGNKTITGNLTMSGTATIVMPNNIGYTVVSTAGSYLSAIKLDSTNVLSIGDNNRANIRLEASIIYTDGEIRATTFKGNLIGNSDTATKLKTPVKIGATNFDGLSSITLDQMKAYSAAFRKAITTEVELDTAIDTGYYWVKGLSINGLYGYGILFVNRDDILVSQIYTSHHGEMAARQAWTYSSDRPGFSQWYNTALTTGNVASATKLQTPRLINYVEFDGTKNIQFGKLISGADFTNSNFRTIVFGNASNMYGFKTVRWTTPIPPVLSGLGHETDGNMFVFTGSDTHGFLALDYKNNVASVGGGNADAIRWTENLAFKNNSFFSYSLDTIGATVTDYTSFNKTGIYRVANNTLGGSSYPYGQLINFRYDNSNTEWRSQIYIPDSGNSKEGIILVRNAYNGTSVESRAWHQIPVLNGYTNLMNVKGFMRVGGLTTHNEANIIMDITDTVAGIGSSGTSNAVQYGKVISIQDPAWHTVQDLKHNFMGRMTIYGNTQSDPFLLTLHGTTVAQNKEASIKFISENSPLQAVVLKYNSYDAIKEPFGLHIIAENSSSGKAYLDVEGHLYIGQTLFLNQNYSSGSWILGRDKSAIRIDLSSIAAGSQYNSIITQKCNTVTFSIGGLNNNSFGIYRYLNTTTTNNTDGSFYMDVNGNMIATGAMNVNGALWCGGIFSCSQSITASGNIAAYSDKKLKTNLIELGDCLNLIKKLNVYRFNWIKDGRHDIGIIAQEIEEVFPEFVTEIKSELDGNVKTVDYGKLSSVLIGAVKELNEKNKQLESRLFALEDMVM